MFKEFQDVGYLDWSLNTTFVQLISKVEGEKQIFYYRPISLLNGAYKLIGKTLAIRLKGVLNEIISEFQCGGIPNRQIQEGVPIANEVLDTRLKTKKLGLHCKIDFKKPSIQCLGSSWMIYLKILALV